MKTRKTERAASRPGLPMLLGAAALAFLSLSVVIPFAQTTGSGQGQGRTSRPGENQSNPKASSTGQLKRMDAGPPAAVMFDGKVRKMEDELGKPPAAGAGPRQEAPNPNAAAAAGQGSQRNRVKEAPGARAHLKLAVQVSRSGAVEVLSATEIPGDPVFTDEPIGDHVYEVEVGGQPVAAEAMQDPFEKRSFPAPPGAGPQEHHVHSVETAVIVVKVPNKRLTDNLGNINVRLHKIKDAGTFTGKINAQTIRTLKQQNRLERRAELPAAALNAQVKAKGKKLPADQE